MADGPEVVVAESLRMDFEAAQVRGTEVPEGSEVFGRGVTDSQVDLPAGGNGDVALGGAEGFSGHVGRVAEAQRAEGAVLGEMEHAGRRGVVLW